MQSLIRYLPSPALEHKWCGDLSEHHMHGAFNIVARLLSVVISRTRECRVTVICTPFDEFILEHGVSDQFGEPESVRLPQRKLLIDQCCAMLKEYYRRSPTVPPRLDVLRRWSRISWRTISDELLPFRSNSDSRWKMVIRAWTRLGDTLEVENFKKADARPQNNSRIFWPEERCAWTECICSVHESHRHLRTCKGCKRVRYCDSNCQRK